MARPHDYGITLLLVCITILKSDQLQQQQNMACSVSSIRQWRRGTSAWTKSQKLLRFDPNGIPKLDHNALTSLKDVPGPLNVVAFVGEGRAGKSFLANSIIGDGSPFLADSTAEPVTHGIEMTVREEETRDEEKKTVVYLDCEGVNNALGGVGVSNGIGHLPHPLVNFLAGAVSSALVFVSDNKITEESLHTLDDMSSKMQILQTSLNTDLVYVVNKTGLDYDQGHLDQTFEMDSECGGTMRENLRKSFPRRSLVAVPHTSDAMKFDGAIGELRNLILETKPLEVQGLPVDGSALCGILESTTEDFLAADDVIIFDVHVRHFDRLLARIKEDTLAEHKASIGKYAGKIFLPPSDPVEGKLLHAVESKLGALPEEDKSDHLNVLREAMAIQWEDVKKAHDDTTKERQKFLVVIIVIVVACIYLWMCSQSSEGAHRATMKKLELLFMIKPSK